MGVICFMKKIDAAGKVTLPKDAMKMLGWKRGMRLEIFFSTAETDRIVLRKYNPEVNLFGERVKKEEC